MSFDAMKWAMNQAVEKSSAKFLLVALANCVNAADGPDMLCWPSTQTLADLTSQDRKTVVDNLRRLREAGYIEPTGAHKGATGQVPVYRLKTPEIGFLAPAAPAPAPAEKKPETGPASAPAPAPNEPESGSVEQKQTDPDFPSNRPEIPHGQTQISLLTDPKTGHGTSKEQGNNQEGTKKKGFDAGAIELPDWLPRADWCRWVADRTKRKKQITDEAARLQLKKLQQYRAEGIDPVGVIDHSIASSYQGLYPSAEARAKAKPARPSKHTGLLDLDHTEGVLEDGSLA